NTSDGSVVYATLGSSLGLEITNAPGTAQNSDNPDDKAIFIFNGQLYITKGSGNVQQVGTNLPTTSNNPVTSTLPNFKQTYDLITKTNTVQHGANPEQVLFLNTNDGTTNNPNIAYIADQSNGVLKFWLDSASIQSATDDGTGLVTVTT